ncbi:hypothetical protein [Segetibacter aerophilus]|nr:hypothetical protein [Segetibacter aerophilus]
MVSEEGYYSFSDDGIL